MSFFDWFKRKKSHQTVASFGKILSGNKLLDKFLKAWPNMNSHKIKLADKNYIMPTEEELKKALFDSKVSSYQYVPEIEDCDDFSLLLHADIIRKRYDAYKAGELSKNQQYPWAFGQIWYQGPTGLHSANICVTCDKGILLIEPQQDSIRKLDKNTIISFIRI